MRYDLHGVFHIYFSNKLMQKAAEPPTTAAAIVGVDMFILSAHLGLNWPMQAFHIATPTFYMDQTLDGGSNNYNVSRALRLRFTIMVHLKIQRVKKEIFKASLHTCTYSMQPLYMYL